MPCAACCSLVCATSTPNGPQGSGLARLALTVCPTLHVRPAVRVQARLLGARDEPVQKQALLATGMGGAGVGGVGVGGVGGSSKELSGRFGPVLRLLLLAIDPAAWRLVHKLSASPACQPAAGALTLMAQSAVQGAQARWSNPNPNPSPNPNSNPNPNGGARCPGAMV